MSYATSMIRSYGIEAREIGDSGLAQRGPAMMFTLHVNRIHEDGSLEELEAHEGTGDIVLAALEDRLSCSTIGEALDITVQCVGLS